MGKTVYIIRGIPGSGKSTIAELLASTNKSSIIHNTDSYHMVNGRYKFNRERLWEFHQMNIEAFEKSCRKGIKVVICDNTNLKKSFFTPYTKIAKKYKYRVFMITVGDFNVAACWKRNKHKVPLSVIRGMKKSFVL